MLKKYIAALAMFHNPALVRDKPLGALASVKLVCYIKLSFVYSRSNEEPIDLLLHVKK